MRRLTFAFVVIGVVLRGWQYLAQVSLWLDEIALARNILDLPLVDLLTKPLLYGQSAPRGFLLVEKLSTLAFGSGELALRLFPQLAGIAALVGFWRVSLRVLTGVGPAVAVAIFALAQQLVWFSSQVKQYSSDVAVAVLLLGLTLDLLSPEVSRRRVWGTALAGAVAAWFSHAALIVLTSLGAYLLWRRVRGRGLAPAALAPVLTLWGGSVLVAALTGLASVTPETREYLKEFWAAGLLPSSFAEAARSLWPLGSYLWAFVLLLISPAAPVYAVFGIVGLWGLCRRRPDEAAVLLAPVAGALLAAVARQYPFNGRLILYLLPTFLIGTAECIERIRLRLVPRLGRGSYAVVVFFVAAGVAPVFVKPPAYRLEDMKTALTAFKDRYRGGDRVYVYYGAAPGYAHYAPRYGLRIGDAAIGGCHRGDARAYLEEVDTMRGQPRVWVVFAHTNDGEDRDIARYLSAIGSERDTVVVRSRVLGWDSPVEIRLYDLSDPVRLRTASAASFPVTSRGRGRSLTFSHLGCGRGPITIVPPTVALARSTP